MASPYISHTCPIPSWSMHVMSRSSYIIASVATFSSSCTLHRNGLCWAKSRSHQVRYRLGGCARASEREWNCLIIVSHGNKTRTWFAIKVIFNHAREHGCVATRPCSSFDEKALKTLMWKFLIIFLLLPFFISFRDLHGGKRGRTPAFTSTAVSCWARQGTSHVLLHVNEHFFVLRCARAPLSC